MDRQVPEMTCTPWAKSSYSNPSGNCLEWRVVQAGGGARVQVRDSRNPGGQVLTFDPAAWATFTAALG
jgi:Domain of unknown function (DUF397)